MTRILRIDSSSRPSGALGAQGGSHSRSLADRVVDRLTAVDPETSVTVRDLVASPLPHIANETIVGYYTPPDAMTDGLRKATALSDRLIDELRDSDVLVLSAPIYNFAPPSALKAWIDQVVRIDRTFAHEDGRFRGLVTDTRAYLVLSYGAGGYADGGPMATMDHLGSYLEMLLEFIGIEVVATFTIEATTADEATVRTARDDALAAIDRTFAA